MARHIVKRRGQRSVTLPAIICLCLAITLLLFSRAGGEPHARALLQRLAQSDRFIAHILTAELGIFATPSEVFAPRATSAARTEEAAAPASEITVLPTDTPNDNPVFSASDKSNTITINNQTSYDVSAATCLSSPTAVQVQQNSDAPQVLIVHTHGSESYTPDATFPYDPTEAGRTTDTQYNVVRVGAELAVVLEQNGIKAMHIQEMFDTPTYSGSYDRALTSITKAVAENPSIQLVIDVHRDSILTDDGRPYQTVGTVRGQEMAQLMLVVGTNDGGLAHDNWRSNLNYAAALQLRLNQDASGLMRPLNLRTQRFNQHVRTGSMLVEVGSSGNTLSEALAAVRVFGEALSRDLTNA